MEPFVRGELRNLFPGDSYDSPEFRPSLAARLFPSLTFYARIFLKDTHWLTTRASRGLCDDTAWCYCSGMVFRDCEKTGMRFRIRGLEILDAHRGPFVFVANHMSTLETFVLPCILRPRLPLTFIVKRSLTQMPFFGHVMRSRDPVVVDRVNPREDLATIMKQGCERLEKGISIVVFPQSTRALRFEPAHFNTIGVKLARRAGVPVVPIALRTDCWGQGRKIKELGRIDATKESLFRIFPPVSVEGSGHAENRAIIEILSKTLEYWERRQRILDEGGAALPVVDPDFVPPDVDREAR